MVLKEKDLIKDSTLILPKKYKKFPFVLNTLDKFGIAEKDILFVRKKSNVKVKDLFFVQCNGQNNPEIVPKIREIVIKNVKHTIDFGEKIYISREKCPGRFLQNEKEFFSLIEKYGFKKVIMEDFCYEDQVSISATAKYMIGPHGAGLSNILFMKDKGYLMELSSRSKPIKPIADYFKLAYFCGLNYLYHECKVAYVPERFAHTELDQTFDQGVLDVDLEKLEKNLQLMLKN